MALFSERVCLLLSNINDEFLFQTHAHRTTIHPEDLTVHELYHNHNRIAQLTPNYQGSPRATVPGEEDLGEGLASESRGLTFQQITS